MNYFQILFAELSRSRDARHREQFHNSKDLAFTISIEAAELNELYFWKTPVQKLCVITDVPSLSIRKYSTTSK